MSAEEATVNADGTTTFDEPQDNDSNGAGGNGEEFNDPPIFDTEEVIKAAKPAVDPAVYFLLAVIIIAAAYYYFIYRKKTTVNEDEFFSNLDGDKVSVSIWKSNHQRSDLNMMLISVHPLSL